MKVETSILTEKEREYFLKRAKAPSSLIERAKALIQHYQEVITSDELDAQKYPKAAEGLRESEKMYKERIKELQAFISGQSDAPEWFKAYFMPTVEIPDDYWRYRNAYGYDPDNWAKGIIVNPDNPHKNDPYERHKYSHYIPPEPQLPKNSKKVVKKSKKRASVDTGKIALGTILMVAGVIILAVMLYG